MTTQQKAKKLRRDNDHNYLREMIIVQNQLHALLINITSEYPHQSISIAIDLRKFLTKLKKECDETREQNIKLYGY